MLVGEPPQTRQTSGQSVPKWRRIAPFVCGLSLSLLCLIFPPAGCAEQVVDVGLDCHGLPHILLGLAVFRVKGLFLFGQLTARLFERVHKLVLTYNYQHGTQTISLEEIESALSSDFDGATPPPKILEPQWFQDFSFLYGSMKRVVLLTLF